jgi:hypothetical protein
MMQLILAKAQGMPQPQGPFEWPLLSKFPGQEDLLKWCQDMGPGTAILLMLLGTIYLLYGWAMFRGLILVNAAIIGGYVGVALGNRYGYPLAGGLLGGTVAGAATWPMMKWAVAVIGGVVGAALGGSVWLSAGYDTTYVWAGALTGLVGFGLFSFILFRASIIMYTSFQGAIMLAMGSLGMAFKYPDLAVKVSSSLSTQPFVLPLFVVLAVVLGLIYQQTHSPGDAGGPAGKR